MERVRNGEEKAHGKGQACLLSRPTKYLLIPDVKRPRDVSERRQDDPELRILFDEAPRLGKTQDQADDSGSGEPTPTERVGARVTMDWNRRLARFNVVDCRGSHELVSRSRSCLVPSPERSAGGVWVRSRPSRMTVLTAP